MSANSHEKDAVRKSTTEARAGVTGHNVRYVLAGGIIGTAVAFLIIYFLFFA